MYVKLLVRCKCRMISCIIYEDNEEMIELYKETIKNYFHERKQKVKFYIFEQYQKNLEIKLCSLEGKKIFILDIEVPGKSGLDLARIIRNSGDWTSPLIIVTSYSHLKSTGFTGKMLMLDFISKKEDIKERLKETLDIVDNIIDENISYTFQYNGELHHINYQDIICFEKDLNDNYIFLYTKQETYKIKENIIKIEKELESYKNFYKINRSCIININNITKLDLKNNILFLENYSTKLSKESCDFLKKNIENHKIMP